ncbi:unnamed protein product [Nesidiocoris tenuis]|uniref:Uncharacterized protein n=1 Tax=Nesidiocoris tenuis TaxID=355587 RepID=A0A6H5G1C3_9HEMI|nr:unnamed protein product [Nesidiocoris tenuis]
MSTPRKYTLGRPLEKQLTFQAQLQHPNPQQLKRRTCCSVHIKNQQFLSAGTFHETSARTRRTDDSRLPPFRSLTPYWMDVLGQIATIAFLAMRHSDRELDASRIAILQIHFTSAPANNVKLELQKVELKLKLNLKMKAKTKTITQTFNSNFKRTPRPPPSGMRPDLSSGRPGGSFRIASPEQSTSGSSPRTNSASEFCPWNLEVRARESTTTAGDLKLGRAARSRSRFIRSALFPGGASKYTECDPHYFPFRTIYSRIAPFADLRGQYNFCEEIPFCSINIGGSSTTNGVEACCQNCHQNHWIDSTQIFGFSSQNGGSESEFRRNGFARPE